MPRPFLQFSIPMENFWSTHQNRRPLSICSAFTVSCLHWIQLCLKTKLWQYLVAKALEVFCHVSIVAKAPPTSYHSPLNLFNVR